MVLLIIDCVSSWLVLVSLVLVVWMLCISMFVNDVGLMVVVVFIDVECVVIWGVIRLMGGIVVMIMCVFWFVVCCCIFVVLYWVLWCWFCKSGWFELLVLFLLCDWSWDKWCSFVCLLVNCLVCRGGVVVGFVVWLNRLWCCVGCFVCWLLRYCWSWLLLVLRLVVWVDSCCYWWWLLNWYWWCCGWWFWVVVIWCWGWYGWFLWYLCLMGFWYG